MAYREVDVVEVKEVLRRWFAGAKKKQIARELGLSPRTVRRYLCWAEEASPARPAGEAPVGDALDVLARAVASRRKEDLDGTAATRGRRAWCNAAHMARASGVLQSVRGQAVVVPS